MVRQTEQQDVSPVAEMVVDCMCTHIHTHTRNVHTQSSHTDSSPVQITQLSSSRVNKKSQTNLEAFTPFHPLH
jgi:hypothetical protein